MSNRCFLRSLGYLKIPELFKQKFGLNSKRKEILKMFPEPKVEMKEEPGDSGTITISYTWTKEDLGNYVERARAYYNIKGCDS